MSLTDSDLPLLYHHSYSMYTFRNNFINKIFLCGIYIEASNFASKLISDEKIFVINLRPSIYKILFQIMTLFL